MGQLLTIDPATGVATAVGAQQMAFDRYVRGLTCDADGTLYGITGLTATRTPEILTIDRSTGVESGVAISGIGGGQLESLELDRSSPTPRLLAAADTLYEIDAGTGVATPVGGSYGKLWGLAEPVPEPHAALQLIFGSLVLAGVARSKRRARRPL